MKTRRELGSVTIEATIALTIFMFAFLGITSLSTLVRAESKVQYALNQTAKELSQYMYIFHRGDTIENPTKPVDELIKEKPDIFDKSTGKYEKWDSLIGSEFSKIPNSYKIIFILLVEENGGIYRLPPSYYI